MARVMNETNAPQLIDEFRKRIHPMLAEQYAATTGKTQDAFTPGIAISEEMPVIQRNDTDSHDQGGETPPLQPGEIPSSPASAPETPKPPVETRTESLPNGRAGQTYDANLDEIIGNLPAQLEIEDDAGTGLALTEQRQLQGTPTGTGSIQMVLVGRDNQGEPVVRLTLKLALIPSSRDLWKDLPSDPEVPYAKPDEEAERLAIGQGWHMAMGSQRGRSHAHRGGQRDDHGVIDRATSGWNVLLVGDGAGSCEFSRQGSLLATTTARDALMTALDGDEGASLEKAALTWWASGDRSRIPQELLMPIRSTVITAVHKGHQAINSEAKASGHPLKAFSTTLLLALHKETPQGQIVVTFGIGDGAVVALSEGSQATLMNTADSGQHAGQTRFLDAPLFQEGEGLYQRVKVRVFDALNAVILATDGVTDPKFDSDNDMQESASWWALYNDLAPNLDTPPADVIRDPLLEYLNFFIERHHDDRTVAVLYRESRDSDDTSAAPAATSAEAGAPETSPAQTDELSEPPELEQGEQKDE